MSKEKQVHEYLKAGGSITQGKALKLFGCGRLSARIWDLRAKGVEIARTMIETTDRYGATIRVAEYRLASK